MATSSGRAAALLELARVGRAWCDEATQRCNAAGLHEPVSAGIGALLRRTGLLVESQRELLLIVRQTGVDFDAADRRRERETGAHLLTLRMLDIAETSRELRRLGLSKDVRARLAITAIAKGRLLSLMASGDGRVVEVLGDLATADHVAVLIPGMTNDIDNYLSDHRRKATSLLAELHKQAKPGETVCVISWLGYNTPDGLRQALSASLAKDGAKQLRRDLAFVRAANPRAHVTVIGHSYGSVVIGQTMRRGLDASDAVAVGSPGMGATDRWQLGSPNVTLWATRVRGRSVVVRGRKLGILPADLVPFAPVHGEDPAAPGFHARRFRSDGVTSHGGYFDPGTGALWNIARIALARSPGVKPTQPKATVAKPGDPKPTAPAVSRPAAVPIPRIPGPAPSPSFLAFGAVPAPFEPKLPPRLVTVPPTTVPGTTVPATTSSVPLPGAKPVPTRSTIESEVDHGPSRRAS